MNQTYICTRKLVVSVDTGDDFLDTSFAPFLGDSDIAIVTIHRNSVLIASTSDAFINIDGVVPVKYISCEEMYTNLLQKEVELKIFGLYGCQSIEDVLMALQCAVRGS